ncbi:cytidylyltransferase family protein [Collimonas arenae]|uniref:Phosphatidate cytidylyltransferase n=1 Tax=Collimonas arenae TaxID=279058 RepID=A0A127PSZ4_9BURK|nr:phosphatidate cytidylyltransferase [Collimonas arenae]AMP00940.1 cytidylyltransferase family protein [Collimonas arenae]AMP10834.1 cytidylyltransferase family protein [Collimonas arenae]
MLRTRVITALLLLAVLLPILYFNYYPAFAVVSALFFAAAIWESARLFGGAGGSALMWGGAALLLFAAVLYVGSGPNIRLLFALCVAIWCLRFVPSLALGLPALTSLGNRLVAGSYAIAVFGCFLAIVVLFHHSPMYLLSVLVIVWAADIGAYFAGKAFGRHKLAPSISPGKSWEGAIGGWLLVLLMLAGFSVTPALTDTFPVRLLATWGWPGALAVMTVLVAASVVGDLFESMLKRRAGVKDSSNLLPGHGGVLDRVDALIPVLPLAALLSFWF